MKISVNGSKQRHRTGVLLQKQPCLGAAKILGFTGRVANTSAPPVGGSGER